MKKQMFSVVWKSFFIMLTAVFLGTLLLTIAFMCPVNEEHREKAYQIMDDEGWYPSVLINSMSLDRYFTSYEPGILDNGTDRIMLTTALDTGTESHFLKRAMNMYSMYLNRNYSYYWHGYVCLLRPLLYLMNYDELRFLNAGGQFAVILFLCLAIKKKTGRMEYVLLLMTSWFLLMPMALAMSLQFTWVFYTGTLGCLVLVQRQEWFEKCHRYIYLFLILGLLTSYFDLLTYPLFTWGTPVLWWMVTGNKDITGFRRVRRVAVAGTGWIAGYAGMWVMKWVVGSVILGENLFEGAFNEVLLRSGAQEGGLYSDFYARLDAVYRNWRHYEYHLYFIVLAIWLIWVILKAFRKGWYLDRDCHAYFLIGLSSIVWYMVLSNHTAEHHFFTYRIFNVSIISFLILLVSSVLPPEERGTGHLCKKRDPRAAIVTVVVLCVAACIFPFLAREEICATNAQCPSEPKMLETGKMLEYGFVPAYSRIRNICICLEPDEPEGMLDIVVLKQSEIIYRENVELEEFAETGYTYLPVEWDLCAGEAYNIQYSVVGNSSPVRVAVTAPDSEPLKEFSQVVLNGEPVEGQPVVIITYWNRPIVKSRLIFLALSWLGILMSAVISVDTLLSGKGRYLQKNT